MFKNFLKNLIANPKSSAMGVGALVMLGKMIAANPSMASDPTTITLILTSLGHLFSGDAKAPEVPKV